MPGDSGLGVAGLSSSRRQRHPRRRPHLSSLVGNIRASSGPSTTRCHRRCRSLGSARPAAPPVPPRLDVLLPHAENGRQRAAAARCKRRYQQSAVWSGAIRFWYACRCALPPSRTLIQKVFAGANQQTPIEQPVRNMRRQ